MTIAAGFACRDGILLCTDSRYSDGRKVDGRKIFPFQLNGGAVAFALAGNAAFAKRAIEECCISFGEKPQDHGSVMGIKTLIENSLKGFYKQFVFRALRRNW
jgi:20S proteasome alpha/beta subunit